MTTIKNTAPIKLGVIDTKIGYTSVYLTHNTAIDGDVVGRVAWVTPSGQSEVMQKYLGDAPYTRVDNLTPNTLYAMTIARYDSMSNDALLTAKFNIAESDPINLSSAKEVTVLSYTVTSASVDVGGAPPVLSLQLDGLADVLEVQYSLAGQNNWTPVWFDSFSTTTDILGMPTGTYDIRVRGVINFPVAPFTEESSWHVTQNVVLEHTFTPPSTPSNIQFAVNKFAEPADRYDTEITWDWSQGSGSDVREFIIQRKPLSGSWVTDVEEFNTGTAQRLVIRNHEFDRGYHYRIRALSWGPDWSNYSETAEVAFTITDATPLTDFRVETGIEITYSHILARRFDTGAWRQTFRLDADTGGLSIGTLDGGVAPITVDGITGDMNVKGSVITDTIASANFVLTNLTGNQPKLHSAAKPSFGNANQGIYMGHNASNEFEFDLGNNTKYIRWDGSDLSISGSVTITGEGSISDIAARANASTTVYAEIFDIGDVPISDGDKTNDFETLSGVPVRDLDIIIYQATNGNRHYRYTAATVSWTPFDVVIDGNLLVTGSVSAAAIAAGTITGNEITSNLHLKVGSGNASTTISGTDPTYRLWAGHDLPANAPFRVTSAGSLEINSGSTSSAMVIENNVIKVFDAGGNLRVQIGDLTA